MKPGILSTIVLASALAAQSARADVYYWDNNNTDLGFGTAGDTWNSAGSTLWNGDSTGGSAGGLLGTTITTTSSDALNFGTATDGLDAGTISVSGTVIANSLTFGSASGAVELSGGTINLAGTTPTITVNNAEDTISAIIEGTEGLVKSGDGTLTLSGANTFSGDRTVTGGTLSGTVAGAFGAQGNTANITISSGATLSYGTNNMFGGHDSTASPSLIVNGGTVTNTGAVVNSMRNITLNGGALTSTGGNGSWRSWIINDTVTSTGTSTISAAGANSGLLLASGTPTNTNIDVQSDTLTVSAVLENGRQSGSPYTARATSLTKQGVGTLILSGNNTFSGDIAVTDGTLIGTVAAAFGATGSGRTITIGSGATVVSGAVNMFGNHNTTSAPTIIINGGTLTNTGGATVSTGFSALNDITLNSGTLTATSGHMGLWRSWSMNSTVTSTGTSTISASGTNGGIHLASGIPTNTDFDVQSGTLNVSALVYDGRGNDGVQTPRATSLTKLGAGTMTLFAANEYTGSTIVSAGTLALGASDVLPNSTAVSLGNATLAVGADFTDTAGILDVTGSAVIDLGDADSKIAFADNGALLTWSGTLNITGTFVPGASVRFGTDASGLTTDQLNLITVNSSGTYTLDPAGYLIASSASGFDSWKTVNGAGLQTLDDDHDNDGVSNGIEYFLGGPAGTTTGFTPMPALTPAGPTFSITWIKGPGYIGTYGTHFQVETSATLDNPWTLETAGVTVTDTPTSVTFTFPAGTKNFARLKVTGP